MLIVKQSKRGLPLETITYSQRPTKVQSQLDHVVELYEIFKISTARDLQRSAAKQIEHNLSFEASWERVSRECDPYLRTASTDRDRSWFGI